MVGGEDCHNRLSALALSEVGEDPCGLMSAESTSSAAAPCAALRPQEISGSGVAFFLDTFSWLHKKKYLASRASATVLTMYKLNRFMHSTC